LRQAHTIYDIKLFYEKNFRLEKNRENLQKANIKRTQNKSFSKISVHKKQNSTLFLLIPSTGTLPIYKTRLNSFNVFYRV